MDVRCLSLLLVVVVAVNGLNRQALLNKPPEMKSFHIDKYLGRWYRAFASYSCKWNGAKFFTDRHMDYTRDDSDGKYKYNSIWRRGKTCANTPGQMTWCGTSRYKYGDNIGVVTSGECVIVATDYKSFAIIWVCVGFDGDKCQDALMNVETRKPGITSRVKEIVDTKLKDIFGISTSDLSAISHTNGIVSGGECSIVATEYKSFAIAWCCVKSVSDKFKYAYVNVDTKKPGITSRVKEIADTILKDIFDISTSYLSAYSHKNAC